MTGRLLAEAIEGQSDRFNMLADVNHVPFPGIGAMRQLMFAAAMAFYKLRDKLP